MPTYDYACRACGTVTEVIHSMAEDGPSTCELCGGALRRVIHPAGIIFKGSGFYRNDSRSSSSSTLPSGDARGKGSDSGGGSSAGATADASSGASTPAETPKPKSPTESSSAT